MINSTEMFSELFGYFCLELILCNAFFSLRSNITLKYFILLVGQDIDINDAYVAIVLALCLKK